ncbi:MAG TPA: hypothetical protein DCE42_00915 [Myxococcales bacterium]|nr:hypothetical protein [Deltaproteobacteria bacterium]MBU54240.1 hypothetical protein [Deltaproteobacteria bacterium]HAA53281.1 hypothetical protein [Myxococcales bacterium]
MSDSHNPSVFRDMIAQQGFNISHLTHSDDSQKHSKRETILEARHLAQHTSPLSNTHECRLRDRPHPRKHNPTTEPFAFGHVYRYPTPHTCRHLSIFVLA